MKKFKLSNLKIGHRLLLGFAFVVIISGVIGERSLHYLNSLSQLTVDMYDHPLTVSNAVRDIKANINAMHRSMKDVAMSDNLDDINIASSLVDDLEKDILKEFEIVHDRFLGDMTDVDKAQRAFTDWKIIRDEVIELSRTNRKQEAIDITRGKGADHVALMNNNIQTMVDFASNKADSFLANAIDKKRETFVLMLALIITLVIISIYVSLIITKSIVNPVKKIIENINIISKEYISQEIEIKSKEEIGILSESFSNMIEQIRIREDDLQIQRHDLSERIKELNCLYGVAEIIEKSGVTLDEIFQGTAELLPPGWHYPEVTCGKVVFNDQIYQTENFKDTPWQQTSDIIVSEKKIGEIVVGYLKEKPDLDEGPFMKEERSLIGALAERLGRVIEGIKSDQKIKEYQENLEKLVDDRTRELEKATKQIRSIVKIAPDAIITIDRESKVILFNPAGEEIFGYSAEEILGKSINILLPEDVRSSHEGFIRDFGSDKNNARMMGKRQEIFGRRKDGTIFPAEAGISKIELDGKMQFTAFFKDITERKKAEKEIIEAKESAEDANKSKSLFLANMSHDIRTPMNAVLGFSEILYSMIDDEQQKEYLSSIRSSGKSLLGLINDILDLSKVEAGKLELDYTAVDIHSVFSEMQQMFTHKVAEKGIEFILDIAPDIPKTLILDEVRLRQILINLLGNSVKFTETGHVILKASVDFVDDDSSKPDLQISVIDTGIGIPDGQKDKVFKAFEQTKGQSVAKFGGTGLGLAITKKLTEMMNGDINVTGIYGEGSSFNLTLHDIAIASVSEMEEYDEDQMDISSIEFEHCSILVVDDIAVNRALVTGYLEPFNLTIFEAENGQEAIKNIRQHRPDAMFMDMRMPVMDGYEATSFLKNDKDLKDVPIIALTASVMKKDEERIKDLADGYLRKPVSRNELIAELTRFLKYTKQEAVQPETETTDSKEDVAEMTGSTSDSVENLPEIMEKLKTVYRPQWNELKDSLTINEIEEFAQDIKDFGKQHQYGKIANWGAMLEKQAGNFDIDAMTTTLAEFPNIIQDIETKI